MSVKIFPINVGFDCCYVIKDEGVIMIDGGAPRKAPEFIKGLKNISIDPNEIQLIIITHGHWDHIGAVKEIQELTGAKILMHKNEKDWLENGNPPLPPGITLWGKAFASFMGALSFLIHIEIAKVDIVMGDNDFSLKEYGISGKVMYTPGHSQGSLSVLLESGETFVGDLAMNKFPLCLSPGLPIFADDLSLVKKSWNNLLDKGSKTIYPSHGEPFSAEIMRKAIL
ncbi:MAG: MBL fold metallo-hydrolase [Bacteroidota bacterium]